MKKFQSGFTLIELVMVIVILGILAAVALPKFIDLQADAAQGAVNGMAGALGSAAAVNFAARTANPANGVAVTSCALTASALQNGTLPANYAITAVGTDLAAGDADGTTQQCRVTYTYSGTSTKTADFTGIKKS